MSPQKMRASMAAPFYQPVPDQDGLWTVQDQELRTRGTVRRVAHGTWEARRCGSEWRYKFKSRKAAAEHLCSKALSEGGDDA